MKTAFPMKKACSIVMAKASKGCILQHFLASLHGKKALPNFQLIFHLVKRAAWLSW